MKLDTIHVIFSLFAEHNFLPKKCYYEYEYYSILNQQQSNTLARWPN